MTDDPDPRIEVAARALCAPDHKSDPSSPLSCWSCIAEAEGALTTADTVDPARDLERLAARRALRAIVPVVNTDAVDPSRRRHETGGGETHACGRAVHKRVTAEECVAALTRAAHELGHPPTVVEYDALRRENGAEWPSAAQVRVRCGTWLAALRAAEMP